MNAEAVRLDAAIGALYASTALGEPWLPALAVLADAAGLPDIHVVSARPAGGHVTALAGNRLLPADLAERLREPAIGADDVSLHPVADRAGVPCTLVLRHGPSTPADTVVRVVLHVTAAWRTRLLLPDDPGVAPVMLALLERLAYPFALVDPDLNVLHVNRAGRSSLQTVGLGAVGREAVGREAAGLEPSGLVRHGRLNLFDPSDLERIRNACQALPEPVEDEIGPIRSLRIRSAGGGTPVAFVAALRRRRFLVMVQPIAGVPEPQRIADSFGLSPTEARLAAHLALGGSAGEAAAAHHVSMATVRTHLRSIYAKTGARSQSDLVRLVAGLPPLTGAFAPNSAPLSGRESARA